MSFVPRPDQQKALAFLDTGGYLGVSAVPGSGKTAILSLLASELVRQRIRNEEEVLIVTFANSAVDNFARRIRGFLTTPTSWARRWTSEQQFRNMTLPGSPRALSPAPLRPLSLKPRSC